MKSFVFSIKYYLSAYLVLCLFSCHSFPQRTSAEDPNQSDYYQEKHRPQYHFSPEANWMNEPNGMFYYDGQYHLFYQYYPDSTVWGPMHWGHAKSTDLVHWEHLPIALFPDSLGCIFSGGAVVDTDNTSGLGSKSAPPILATFTHHNFEVQRAGRNDFQTQSVAYSIDGGSSWTKYEQNPVIANTDEIRDFRDPKVVWHQPSQQWIMVLAAYDRAKFYASKNLLEWTFLSDFGIPGDKRLWECPDFFPIKTKGSTGMKWVLIVSMQRDAPNGGTGTSYFVGDFDGTQFQSDPAQQKWLDWGTDNYAFVTWNNAPLPEEDILGIGWMSNWQYATIVPTEKWRSAMTLPRILNLVNTKGTYLLESHPVPALNQLRGEGTAYRDLAVTGIQTLDDVSFSSKTEMALKVDLQQTDASLFGLQLKNAQGEAFTISFDTKKDSMFVDRTTSGREQFSDVFYDRVHSAPVDLQSEILEVQIYFDVSSAEIFINNGELVFTSIYFPTIDFDQVAMFSKEGTCTIDQLTLYPLDDIWRSH